jgi:Mediator complex subunit 26 C-terminal
MTASIVTEPPRMTDADLLQVKAERVRNFVQMTCDAAAPPVDNDLLSIIGSESRAVLPTFGSSEPMVPVCPPGTTDLSLPKSGATVPACLPELPVIDESSIDWTSNDYVVPDTRPAPTALDVNRLHLSNWEGVNGQWDYRGEWSDWTRSYSARTHSDDLLHILPYIDLTD